MASVAAGYLRRLLPSLSSSMESGSTKSYSSKLGSSSSTAIRVAFCVLGFSTSGGAPAMICLARRAANTTYANWLSGAFVSTVISVIPPQTMPEVFLPGPDAALLYNAAPLQLLALRVPHVRYLHSRRNSRNIFQTPRFHRALSASGAQYPRLNSVLATAAAFPVPAAQEAK